jgi:uncharacterized membrane protein
MTLADVIGLFGWPDWAALVWFFTLWIGYAAFARARANRGESLLATTNRFRLQWTLQTTYRDNRVIDGVVVQNLGTSPSFFASTTILIIGGLLAVLGTSEKATELVREIPFAARTSVLVFDLKLLLLTGIFVYAFFRFTWSLRQYTFGALLIASMPDATVFAREEADRDEHARRAGRVVGLAAETFNDGLRAYYFAFPAVLWFFAPVAFAVGAAIVVTVLYQREFKSDVLAVMRDPPPP